MWLFVQGDHIILTPFGKWPIVFKYCCWFLNILHGIPFRIILEATDGRHGHGDHHGRPVCGKDAKSDKVTKNRLKQLYDAQPAIQAACPCGPCPCCMSMSMSMSILLVHVRATYPCPCCMFMSMLHVHVHAPCPCPCCMSCPCSISI
jgi:hypothetical protein